MPGDKIFNLFIHADWKIFHYHNIRSFHFDGIINGCIYVVTIFHEDYEPEEIHFHIPEGKEFMFEVICDG